jgi:hypothetical protein
MTMKNNRPTSTATASAESAEQLAISILTWLSSRPDLMGRFLAISGIEASSIREAAREPGFFGGVTGFLMNHEPTLMEFCADNDVAADVVAACHRRLAGPDESTWS